MKSVGIACHSPNSWYRQTPSTEMSNYKTTYAVYAAALRHRCRMRTYYIYVGALVLFILPFLKFAISEIRMKAGTLSCLTGCPTMPRRHNFVPINGTNVQHFTVTQKFCQDFLPYLCDNATSYPLFIGKEVKDLAVMATTKRHRRKAEKRRIKKANRQDRSGKFVGLLHHIHSPLPEHL